MDPHSLSNLDPDTDLQSQKKLDPEPLKDDADPKH
jgi:hypothetical protein